MKQFDLSVWLKVTRSGHNVRILCTDQRGNMPIVALVEFETLDGVQLFYHDEKNESRREYDLFFADKEELTEFERELEMMMVSFSNGNLGSDVIKEMSKQKIHDYAHRLIDLAKKEILRDLPKWKKATEHKDLKKHIAILEENKVLLSDYLEEGDYYIDLEDLKTLPKKE
jgi:hypothetical protein